MMTSATTHHRFPEDAGPPERPLRAEARVDLDAIRANTRRLRAIASTGGSNAQVMAVVKADGYGHGAVACARAAREAGAAWLGTALPEEALELRAAGLDGPILSWLNIPGTPWDELIAADVDVTAYSLHLLLEIVAAARRHGRPARVQLKADTGLGRGGTQPHDWTDLVEAAAKAEADGLVKVTGVWSHFACADEPGHPSIAAQLAAFQQALAAAEQAGLTPEVRHMANSPATLLIPEAHFDLVRPGLALYGLSPVPDIGGPARFGLTPAMTLAARVALVKRAPRDHGVSYGHIYHTAQDTTLALIPLGYADGLPRNSSNVAEVFVGGRRRRVAGRMAMDQFVVDLDDPATDEVRAGDEAIVFGPGDRGEPTAEDWARAVGTLSYEIVTRIGPRVPRVYLGQS
jgi:alanine racemase